MTAKPKLPPDTITRINLGTPYEGFWVDVYDDTEMGVFEDMISGDLTRIFSALALMVKASNAITRKGEPADLTTAEGWRRQRRSFVEETTDRIKEAWEHPKASSTGSATSSRSALERSTTPST